MKVIFRDAVKVNGDSSVHLVGIASSNLQVNNLIRTDYEVVKKGKAHRNLEFYTDYTGAFFEYDGGNVIWTVQNVPTDQAADILVASYSDE